MIDPLKQQARESAFLGLDFFTRTQCSFGGSADCGRYVNIADIVTGDPVYYTSNWLSGIVTSTMLDVWKMTGEEKYRASADLALRYLFSLQDLASWHKRTYGAIHEVVPQQKAAHPRDGLSAAAGMLDYALLAGSEEAFRRAVLFGEWFIRCGMEPGYPVWTVHFDRDDWPPFWHGSFHSGSAFFLARLCRATGREEFLAAARKILDFYNREMLSERGDITVIREHGTMKVLDEVPDLPGAPVGWIQMHKYNDDFGALANLVVGELTGESVYTDKAMLFLRRMRECQRSDGGFGPENWAQSIPNAAGMILTELMSARQLGCADGSFDEMAERAARYLIGQQIIDPSSRFHGAFHGMNGEYQVDSDHCNARAGIYAVMALLRFAGCPACTFAPEFPENKAVAAAVAGH